MDDIQKLKEVLINGKNDFIMFTGEEFLALYE